MPIELPPNYLAFKDDFLSDQEQAEHGVFEVLWFANNWYGDQPLSTRLATAESVVLDLLREGLVVLVWGEWAGPDQVREAVTDPEAVLRDWTTWVPQPEGRVVWMANARR